MYKYIPLIALTLISCSKSDESDISTSDNLVNNVVGFVNSGNIYFENNTCKCPDAINGDKDIISGTTYTAVNNSSIKDELANGNIYLCTTLVTNMSGTSVSSIFQNFFNNNSFNSNIGFWDVSNVTNMDGMFYNADTFNQDISNWNTSKVDNMGSMFKNASLFNGLKRPEVLRLFSTIIEISDPIFSFLRIFSKLFFDISSIDKGDTAKGRGFRFPRVISTSIKAKAFMGKINVTNKIRIFFIIYL